MVDKITSKITPELWEVLSDPNDPKGAPFFQPLARSQQQTGLSVQKNDAEVETELLDNGDIQITYHFPLDNNENPEDGRIDAAYRVVFDSTEQQLKKMPAKFEYTLKGSNQKAWQDWLAKYQNFQWKDAKEEGAFRAQQNVFNLSLARAYPRMFSKDILAKLKENQFFFRETARSIEPNELKFQKYNGKNHHYAVFRGEWSNTIIFSHVIEDKPALNKKGRPTRKPQEGNLILLERFDLFPDLSLAQTNPVLKHVRQWVVAPESPNQEFWSAKVATLNAREQNPTKAEVDQARETAWKFIKNFVPTIFYQAPELKKEEYRPTPPPGGYAELTPEIFQKSLDAVAKKSNASVSEDFAFIANLETKLEAALKKKAEREKSKDSGPFKLLDHLKASQQKLTDIEQQINTTKQSLPAEQQAEVNAMLMLNANQQMLIGEQQLVAQALHDLQEALVVPMNFSGVDRYFRIGILNLLLQLKYSNVTKALQQWNQLKNICTEESTKALNEAARVKQQENLKVIELMGVLIKTLATVLEVKDVAALHVALSPQLEKARTQTDSLLSPPIKQAFLNSLDPLVTRRRVLEGLGILTQVATEQVALRYQKSLAWGYDGPEIDVQTELAVANHLFEKAIQHSFKSRAKTPLALIAELKDLDPPEKELQKRFVTDSILQHLSDVILEGPGEKQGRRYFEIAKRELHENELVQSANFLAKYIIREKLPKSRALESLEILTTIVEEKSTLELVEEQQKQGKPKAFFSQLIQDADELATSTSSIAVADVFGQLEKDYLSQKEKLAKIPVEQLPLEKKKQFESQIDDFLSIKNKITQDPLYQQIFQASQKPTPNGRLEEYKKLLFSEASQKELGPAINALAALIKTNGISSENPLQKTVNNSPAREALHLIFAIEVARLEAPFNELQRKGQVFSSLLAKATEVAMMNPESSALEILNSFPATSLDVSEVEVHAAVLQDPLLNKLSQFDTTDPQNRRALYETLLEANEFEKEGLNATAAWLREQIVEGTLLTVPQISNQIELATFEKQLILSKDIRDFLLFTQGQASFPVAAEYLLPKVVQLDGVTAGSMVGAALLGPLGEMAVLRKLSWLGKIPKIGPWIYRLVGAAGGVATEGAAFTTLNKMGHSYYETPVGQWDPEHLSNEYVLGALPFGAIRFAHSGVAAFSQRYMATGAKYFGWAGGRVAGEAVPVLVETPMGKQLIFSHVGSGVPQLTAAGQAATDVMYHGSALLAMAGANSALTGESFGNALAHAGVFYPHGLIYFGAAHWATGGAFNQALGEMKARNEALHKKIAPPSVKGVDSPATPEVELFDPVRLAGAQTRLEKLEAEMATQQAPLQHLKALATKIAAEKVQVQMAQVFGRLTREEQLSVAKKIQQAQDLPTLLKQLRKQSQRHPSDAQPKTLLSILDLPLESLPTEWGLRAKVESFLTAEVQKFEQAGYPLEKLAENLPSKEPLWDELESRYHAGKHWEAFQNGLRSANSFAQLQNVLENLPFGKVEGIEIADTLNRVDYLVAKDAQRQLVRERDHCREQRRLKNAEPEKNPEEIKQLDKKIDELDEKVRDGNAQLQAREATFPQASSVNEVSMVESLPAEQGIRQRGRDLLEKNNYEEKASRRDAKKLSAEEKSDIAFEKRVTRLVRRYSLSSTSKTFLEAQKTLRLSFDEFSPAVEKMLKTLSPEQKETLLKAYFGEAQERDVASEANALKWIGLMGKTGETYALSLVPGDHPTVKVGTLPKLTPPPASPTPGGRRPLPQQLNGVSSNIRNRLQHLQRQANSARRALPTLDRATLGRHWSSLVDRFGKVPPPIPEYDALRDKVLDTACQQAQELIQQGPTIVQSPTGHSLDMVRWSYKINLENGEIVPQGTSVPHEITVDQIFAAVESKKIFLMDKQKKSVRTKLRNAKDPRHRVVLQAVLDLDGFEIGRAAPAAPPKLPPPTPPSIPPHPSAKAMSGESPLLPDANTPLNGKMEFKSASEPPPATPLPLPPPSNQASSAKATEGLPATPDGQAESTGVKASSDLKQDAPPPPPTEIDALRYFPPNPVPDTEVTPPLVPDSTESKPTPPPLPVKAKVRMPRPMSRPSSPRLGKVAPPSSDETPVEPGQKVALLPGIGADFVSIQQRVIEKVQGAVLKEVTEFPEKFSPSAPGSHQHSMQLKMNIGEVTGIDEFLSKDILINFTIDHPNKLISLHPKTLQALQRVEQLESNLRIKPFFQALIALDRIPIVLPEGNQALLPPPNPDVFNYNRQHLFELSADAGKKSYLVGRLTLDDQGLITRSEISRPLHELPSGTLYTRGTPGSGKTVEVIMVGDGLLWFDSIEKLNPDQKAVLLGLAKKGEKILKKDHEAPNKILQQRMGWLALDVEEAVSRYTFQQNRDNAVQVDLQLKVVEEPDGSLRAYEEEPRDERSALKKNKLQGLPTKGTISLGLAPVRKGGFEDLGYLGGFEFEINPHASPDTTIFKLLKKFQVKFVRENSAKLQIVPEPASESAQASEAKLPSSPKIPSELLFNGVDSRTTKLENEQVVLNSAIPIQNALGVVIGETKIVAGSENGEISIPFRDGTIASGHTRFGKNPLQDDAIFLGRYALADGTDVKILACGDGVGGSDWGGLASSSFLQGVHAKVQEFAGKNAVPLAGELFSGGAEAVRFQNTERQKQNPNYRTATTGIVVVIAGNQATAAVAGDSLLTLSYSKDGHPQTVGYSNLDSAGPAKVTRTVGSNHEPHFYRFELEDGAKITLGTDGFWERLFGFDYWKELSGILRSKAYRFATQRTFEGLHRLFTGIPNGELTAITLDQQARKEGFGTGDDTSVLFIEHKKTAELKLRDIPDNYQPLESVGDSAYAPIIERIQTIIAQAPEAARPSPTDLKAAKTAMGKFIRSGQGRADGNLLPDNAAMYLAVLQVIAEGIERQPLEILEKLFYFASDVSRNDNSTDLLAKENPRFADAPDATLFLRLALVRRLLAEYHAVHVILFNHPLAKSPTFIHLAAFAHVDPFYDFGKQPIATNDLSHHVDSMIPALMKLEAKLSEQVAGLR